MENEMDLSIARFIREQREREEHGEMYYLVCRNPPECILPDFRQITETPEATIKHGGKIEDEQRQRE